MLKYTPLYPVNKWMWFQCILVYTVRSKDDRTILGRKCYLRIQWCYFSGSWIQTRSTTTLFYWYILYTKAISKTETVLFLIGWFLHFSAAWFIHKQHFVNDCEIHLPTFQQQEQTGWIHELRASICAATSQHHSTTDTIYSPPFTVDQ